MPALHRALVALFGLLVVTVLPARAHAQLTVDALELHMALSESPDVRTVRVRNDGAARVQAAVKIEDWDRDEHGANRFLPIGSHAQSCAAALEVFPASLVLEPGEAANLRISLSTSGSGERLARNCWSVVFLENRASQITAGRQISYNVRTGIKVYGASAQARRDGAIEDMQLSDSAAAQLSIAFRNLGDVQLQVRGAVEVRRDDNSVVKRTDVDPFPILPSQRRVLHSMLPALPKGRYILLALLDYGGSEIVAGQLEYEVR